MSLLEHIVCFGGVWFVFCVSCYQAGYWAHKGWLAAEEGK